MKTEALGKLILVTGFFGGGKSSIAREVMDRVNDLTYLRTITTRPPRQEELDHGTDEYEFVSGREYYDQMSASNKWDHTLFSNHSYGADVELANKKLLAGHNLICCIAPDEDTITQMSELYLVKPIIIWIDTPLEVANDRLIKSGNERRAARPAHQLQNNFNAEKIKRLVQIIFKPTQNLNDDGVAFTKIVRQLLNSL